MQTKQINYIEVYPDQLKQPTGNLMFMCVEQFVEELTKEDDLYIKIVDEPILYHKSQAAELTKRLKELVNEGEEENSVEEDGKNDSVQPNK